MVGRDTLIAYVNQLLEIDKFQDYCPNGLQVEGRDRVRKLVTGVSACQALLDAAVLEHADLILVHHGYFWRGEPEILQGIKKNRIKTLLNHDINLIAYHLPLDAHPIYGNNAQLAKKLELTIIKQKNQGQIPGLLFHGELLKPLTPEALAHRIQKVLKREPFLEKTSEKKIKRLSWCTGAAQDYLSEAVQNGSDAYLTGEVSERTIHEAREYQIHFFACGHHATERYGVQALGQHLAKSFNIEHLYIEIENPI